MNDHQEMPSRPTRGVPPRSIGTQLIPHPGVGLGAPTDAATGPSASPRPASARWAAQGTGRLATVGYDFLVAQDPAVWPDGEGHTSGLLDLPGPDQVAALGTLSAGGQALVIITDTRQEARVRALAARARGLYEARIAVVPIAAGPAMQATAALIGQVLLASTSARRPVAEIVERLPSLCDQLVHLVLLRSVSTVDHPAVTVRHHVRSYLPGRRMFVLQTSPEPKILRLDGQGRIRPSDADLAGPGFDIALGVWINVLGPRPIPVPVLERCGIGGPVSALQTSLSPARYWPDPEATEVVAFPQDLVGWVNGQLPAVEAWPCHWCGEPLAAPVRSCPFCADTLI